MNYQAYDLLSALLDSPYISQRELSQRCGLSLGGVNNALKMLTQAGYLQDGQLTEAARSLDRQSHPKNAIILAAGFGMRMVPINTQTPKALLEVHGEVLIERTIRQLRQAGVQTIQVVVGFMKEHFEYLMDDFGVELICNNDYAAKNNLHSLALALPHLSDSYIVPCDIWCRENPFRTREFYSYYMVSDRQDPDSDLRINRKRELVKVSGDAPGNAMIGIAYITAKDAPEICQKICTLREESSHDQDFWEEAVLGKDRMCLPGRVVSQADAVEINTYEQLRSLDSGSNQLKSDAIQTITKALNASANEITQITVLKKGMTNRSFLFTCQGKKYIMRIPGEGTDQLINRAQEAAVYQAIDGRNICDDIAYINPSNGYKITAFLENSRVCDPLDAKDVAACMQVLRNFHQQKLTVDHTFDIFRLIDFYEDLWDGHPSCYRDYQTTKANVLSLQAYIDAQEKDWVLTHIDAVPDNFLFVTAPDGSQEIRLIDWEYAGMQDPHVDIAMFCIYAMYDRDHVEKLIDAYFPQGCNPQVRTKIYCYISACGLLWSNWCEYKRQLGVEFGEYSLKQYRFAKDYYKLATERMGG